MSNNDDNKAALAVAADAAMDGAVAAASLLIAHDPLTAGALAAAGGLGKVVFKQTVMPRATSFWGRLLGRDATSEAAQKLVESNPEAVLQAVRRLSEADPVVIPALADLTREYLGPPPKEVDAFFRDFAQLLSELPAREFVGLQRILTLATAHVGNAREVILAWGRLGVERDPYVRIVVEGPEGFREASREPIIRANRVLELVRAKHLSENVFEGSGAFVMSDVPRATDVTWAPSMTVDEPILRRMLALVGKCE